MASALAGSAKLNLPDSGISRFFFFFFFFSKQLALLHGLSYLALGVASSFTVAMINQVDFSVSIIL